MLLLDIILVVEMHYKSTSENIDLALSIMAERKKDKVVGKCLTDASIPDTVLLKRKRQCGDGGGTAKLTELYRLLDSFGMQRSRVQKQLHTGMVGSVMQRIYCGESDAEMKYGAAKFHVTSCRQQFMAITPR